MQADEAVGALTSLAQEHRLAAFRLLVQAGHEGLSAGEIARTLDIAPSSLSFHLAHLMRAGLISQERQSRNLIYRAEFARMNALVAYMLENCCAGQVCEADAAALLGECQ